jgi:hypothetical protein
MQEYLPRKIDVLNMKVWYWIFLFSFSSLRSFAQSVRLSVIADKQPALGASIFINGKMKAIADEQGKVQLSKIQYGDTIQISYLGYKPEIIVFSSHHKELNINLIQESFEIGEVKVSPGNDRLLFRKMLKWGLQEALIYKETSFCLKDTLQFSPDTNKVYRQCTGEFISPKRGCQVVVKKSQTELLLSTSETARQTYLSEYGNGREGDLFKNMKIPDQDIEICFIYLYALTHFNKKMKLTYLGKDSTDYDRFYFYVPDGDWVHNLFKLKSYLGGIVFLDAEGVIEKIKVHKTALNASVRSYEFDIDYVYDKKYNEAVPYRAAIQTYRLDEDLNVILTRPAYLEIYSKQAIDAGVFTPEN